MYAPLAIASQVTRVRFTRRSSPTRDASATSTCGCPNPSQTVTISWRATTPPRPARSAVHHDHLDGPILGREDRQNAALDVHRLVPGRDDHRYERAGAPRGIVRETGATRPVAIDEQGEERGVSGGNPPDHSGASSSTAATPD